jgi:hypothetical protein
MEEKGNVSTGAAMRRLRRVLNDLALDQLFASDQIIFDGELFVLPKLSSVAVSRIATRLEQLSEQSSEMRVEPSKQVAQIFQSDHQDALNKELTEFHSAPTGYAVALVKVDQ